MSSQKVLIIDDDEQVVELVSRQLENLGYEYDHAPDGASGLEMAIVNEYELVVLDLGLPKLGGVEVCRRLREQNESVPILILTGDSNKTNTVLTLELGADEFVGKPFDGMELKARIRALLRRSKLSGGGETKADSEPPAEMIYVKDLEIDLKLCQVKVGGQDIGLTANEFELMTIFATNTGKVLSREELVTQLWGQSNYSYENNIKTALSRLRSKLDASGSQSPYIVTHRGFGYRLVESDES